MKAKLDPVHPGEVLKEDFLVPLGITPYRLAQELSIPPIRVTQIINGKRAVSVETALLLAHYFGTSAELWLGLQADYDLETAPAAIQERLKAIKPFKQPV
jgi:addiction module HigA family antidote